MQREQVDHILAAGHAPRGDVRGELHKQGAQRRRRELRRHGERDHLGAGLGRLRAGQHGVLPLVLQPPLHVHEVQRVVPRLETRLLRGLRERAVQVRLRREVRELAEAQHRLLRVDPLRLCTRAAVQHLGRRGEVAQRRVVHPGDPVVLRVRCEEGAQQRRVLRARLQQPPQRAVLDVVLVQLRGERLPVRVEVALDAHLGGRLGVRPLRALRLRTRLGEAQLGECAKVAVLLRERECAVRAPDRQERVQHRRPRLRVGGAQRRELVPGGRGARLPGGRGRLEARLPRGVRGEEELGERAELRAALGVRGALPRLGRRAGVERVVRGAEERLEQLDAHRVRPPGLVRDARRLDVVRGAVLGAEARRAEQEGEQEPGLLERERRVAAPELREQRAEQRGGRRQAVQEEEALGVRGLLAGQRRGDRRGEHAGARRAARARLVVVAPEVGGAREQLRVRAQQEPRARRQLPQVPVLPNEGHEPLRAAHAQRELRPQVHGRRQARELAADQRAAQLLRGCLEQLGVQVRVECVELQRVPCALLAEPHEALQLLRNARYTRLVHLRRARRERERQLLRRRGAHVYLQQGAVRGERRPAQRRRVLLRHTRAEHAASVGAQAERLLERVERGVEQLDAQRVVERDKGRTGRAGRARREPRARAGVGVRRAAHVQRHHAVQGRRAAGGQVEQSDAVGVRVLRDAVLCVEHREPVLAGKVCDALQRKAHAVRGRVAAALCVERGARDRLVERVVVRGKLERVRRAGAGHAPALHAACAERHDEARLAARLLGHRGEVDHGAAGRGFARTAEPAAKQAARLAELVVRELVRPAVHVHADAEEARLGRGEHDGALVAARRSGHQLAVVQRQVRVHDGLVRGLHKGVRDSVPEVHGAASGAHHHGGLRRGVQRAGEDHALRRRAAAARHGELVARGRRTVAAPHVAPLLRRAERILPVAVDATGDGRRVRVARQRRARAGRERRHELPHAQHRVLEQRRALGAGRRGTVPGRRRSEHDGCQVAPRRGREARPGHVSTRRALERV